MRYIIIYLLVIEVCLKKTKDIVLKAVANDKSML